MLFACDLGCHLFCSPEINLSSSTSRRVLSGCNSETWFISIKLLKIQPLWPPPFVSNGRLYMVIREQIQPKQISLFLCLMKLFWCLIKRICYKRKSSTCWTWQQDKRGGRSNKTRARKAVSGSDSLSLRPLQNCRFSLRSLSSWTGCKAVWTAKLSGAVGSQQPRLPSMYKDERRK